MSETRRHRSWKTQNSDLKGSSCKHIPFTWWSRMNEDTIVQIRE